MIAAVILFMAIWLLPLAVREFRNSMHLLLMFWFVIALHQAVAFTNAFWFTTLGADADATTFHLVGTELAQSESFIFAIGSKFYENMLGVVYWFFGSSHLLGQQLSILAFALSCIVLIKILRLLKLSQYKVSILLVFGALPTMVLLGSITLRESYQVLFFMLAVYFGIKMHIKGGVNTYLVAMIISALIMGLFHHALPVYAVFMIVLMTVWVVRPVSHFWAIKKLRLVAVLIIPVLLVGVYILSNMQIHGLAGLTALSDMNLLKDASGFREKAHLSRATYGVSLDLSTPVMAIYSSVLLYIHYLFSPFPWQIRNILDVYAFIESALRFILIYYAIKHWHYSFGMQKRLFGLLLILFFSMSFMWATGTTNYGTAMRHHMVTWWILVVMGLPLLLTSMHRVRLDFTSGKKL